MNNVLPPNSGGIMGTNGGLARQRMSPPARDNSPFVVPNKSFSRTPSSDVPERSFMEKKALGRSADFLRAKVNYERMMNMGKGAKELQQATFYTLKDIEKKELEKQNKKTKRNDIYQR